MHKVLLCCSIVFFLFSCKAKVPEDVISREKMEKLLYDYHLAQALAKNAKDSVDFRQKLYIDAVFQKYHVDEEKFNHSMEWYTRNSEELFKIYKKIDLRFEEARSTTKTVGNQYANMTAEGDTMNIWSGRDFYLLSSVWNNRMDFEQLADTSFSKGDRLMWEFETNWYYREGQKNAMAKLSVIYENDSVASTMQSLYSTGKQDIYITVGSRPVKAIQGFIYQVSPWTDIPNILTISHPVLVRFKHGKPLKMKDVINSNASPSVTLKQDSLTEKSSDKVDSLKTEHHRREAQADGNEKDESLIDKRIRMTNPPENQRILHLPK